MKFLDISQTIRDGMKKYPSDPEVRVRQSKSLKNGDSCNLKEISLGSHTGTHIDAPSHILKGADTADNIRISDLFSRVIVIGAESLSDKNFLKRLKSQNIRGVLLKKNKNKAVITTWQAKELVKNKIKIVGTEELSIEGLPDKAHPVHRILLDKGTIIIEGLNLKRAKSGVYNLICLPLKIKNSDGAPARAVLAYD